MIGNQKRGLRISLMMILLLVFSFQIANAELSCTNNRITKQFSPDIQISFEEDVYLYNPYLESEDDSRLSLIMSPDESSMASDFTLTPEFDLVPGKRYLLFLNYSDYFLNYDYLADTCIMLDLPSLNISIESPKYGVFNSSSEYFMKVRTSRESYECSLFNHDKGIAIAQLEKINNYTFQKTLTQDINNYESSYYNHTYSKLPLYDVVCKEGVPTNYNNVQTQIKLGYDTTRPNMDIKPESSENTFSSMLITIESKDDEVLCKFDEKDSGKSFDEMEYEVTTIDESGFFKKHYLYLTDKDDSPYRLSLFDSKEYGLEFICMNRAGYYSESKEVSFFINTSATFEIRGIDILGSNKRGYVGDDRIRAYVKTNLDLSSECTIESNGKTIESKNSFVSSNLYYHNFSEDSFFKAGKNELLIVCENGRGTRLTDERTIYLDVDSPQIRNITIPREVCLENIDFSLAFTEQNPTKIIVQIKEASKDLTAANEEFEYTGNSPFEEEIEFNGSDALNYYFDITLVDISKNTDTFTSDTFKYNTHSPICGDSTPPRTTAKSSVIGSQLKIDLTCYDISDNDKESSGCEKIMTLNSRFNTCPSQSEIYGSTLGNKTSIFFSKDDIGYTILCYFSIDEEGNSEEVKIFNLTKEFKKTGFIDTEEPEPEDNQSNEIDPALDTDGDGMPDYWEIKYGLDINDSSDADLDYDSDGLTNYREYELGTDPTVFDTDGDTYSDGKEVDEGTDPLDPNDYPREIVPPKPPEKKTKILPWILLIIGIILIVSGTVYLNLTEVKVMLGLEEPRVDKKGGEVRDFSDSVGRKEIDKQKVPQYKPPQEKPIQAPQPNQGSYDSRIAKLGFLGKYRKSLFKDKQKKRSSVLDSFDVSLDGKAKQKKDDLENIPTYEEATKNQEMQKILDDIINKKLNNLEKEGEIKKEDRSASGTFEKLAKLSQEHKDSIFDELDRKIGTKVKRERIDQLIKSKESDDFEKLDKITGKKGTDDGKKLDDLIEKDNKESDLDDLIENKDERNSKEKKRKDNDSIDDLRGL